MTITKALRKLYKVIVGEEAPANANTITKVLLALAEAWTGSGGGSGGGGVGETIMVTYNEDHTVKILNKTVDEIVQMLSNGSSPFVVDIGDYHSPTPFYNVGYINKITFNDRTGEYDVNVSGQEGGLTYTSASWNEYPIRNDGPNI